MPRRPKHGRGLDKAATRGWQLPVDVRWYIPDTPDPRDLTSEEIKELLCWINEKDLPSCFRFFRTLAELSPKHRLTRNLTRLMKLMLHVTIKDVLVEGLTSDEHDTLRALEMANVPVARMATAHALLNVEERRAFISTFGLVFRDLYTRRGGFVDPALFADFLETDTDATS